MSEGRILPTWSGPGERPETGAMQFGDDWPGVFIRGDDAMHYAMSLRAFLNGYDNDVPTRSALVGFIDLLSSCNVHRANR